MAVISASRRSDIPAFYADWFVQRLRAGVCRVASPFGGPTREVDLRPQAVEAFVFWSKDLTRFAPVLTRIEALGYRGFVFQNTITGAPRWLEPEVPEAEKSIAAVADLARRYGRHALTWRFDPLVITEKMDFEEHLARFRRLAAGMEGHTRRVVTSFVDRYKKTERNLLPALAARGDRLLDDDPPARRAFLRELARVAESHGMRLSLCCESAFVSPELPAARCIDPEQLSLAAGRRIVPQKRPTRSGCNCVAAIDIGAYNTCTHGCLYCYANASKEAARRNRAAIRSDSPILGVDTQD